MATTQIPWGDPKAVKRWSPKLAMDIQTDGYFQKRFIGRGSNNIIEEKTELEADAGDTISFDLAADLRGEPTFGDDRVEGREEQLRFATDTVSIDQLRKSVSAGGRMSRKRTEHDLRKTAADALRRYWAKFMDEHHFITLSGARGHNQGFILGTGYSGFANNPLMPPDALHLVYGGDATSKATVDATDTMSRALIERVSTYARMLKAENPDATNMVPLNVEGGEHFVMIMSPYQESDLRSEIGAGGWLDLQKAASGAEGFKSPIFKGGLGMLNNVILHSHENVIRFSDYGAGGNVPAARAMFCGRQAAAIAYGTTQSQRFIWKELLKDYENEPSVAGGYIFGEKKSRFNGYDFGLISVDTAARNPA